MDSHYRINTISGVDGVMQDTEKQTAQTTKWEDKYLNLIFGQNIIMHIHISIVCFKNITF